MQHRKRGTPRETPFEYFPELTIGRRTLWPGDPVKLTRTRGKTYQFQSLRTDTRDGSQTVVVKGPVTMFGAGMEHVVDMDRIVLPPKRRKRVTK